MAKLHATFSWADELRSPAVRPPVVKEGLAPTAFRNFKVGSHTFSKESNGRTPDTTRTSSSISSPEQKVLGAEEEALLTALREHLLEKKQQQSSALSSSCAFLRQYGEGSKQQSPQSEVMKKEVVVTRAGVPAGMPPVGEERDSEETEDAVDFRTLLFESDGEALDSALRFACGFDQRVFNGWVKQPSPCCAGAAIVGAYNALRGLKRSDEQASGVYDGTRALAGLMEEQLEVRRQRFRRLLGLPPPTEGPDGVLGSDLIRPLEEAVLEALRTLQEESGADAQGAAEKEAEQKDPDPVDLHPEAPLRKSTKKQVRDAIRLVFSRVRRGEDEVAECDDAELAGAAAAATTASVEEKEAQAPAEDLKALVCEVPAVPIMLPTSPRAHRGEEKAKDETGKAETQRETAGEPEERPLPTCDNQDVFAVLRQILESEQDEELFGDENQPPAAPGRAEEPDEEKEVPEDPKALKGAGALIAVGVGAASGFVTSLRKELAELMAKRKGVLRLRNEPRPNTSEVGNWGINAGAQRLFDMIEKDEKAKGTVSSDINNPSPQREDGFPQEPAFGSGGCNVTSSVMGGAGGQPQENPAATGRSSTVAAAATNVGSRVPMSSLRATGVKVTSFMGLRAGGPVEVPLARMDDQSKADAQWAALRTALSNINTNSVLLFHLTNHYALVFAWREWLGEEKKPLHLVVGQREETDESESKDSSCEKGGEPQVVMRREVLTARRGQRPSAWIDFEECRQIMLNWAGYRILRLEAVP